MGQAGVVDVEAFLAAFPSLSSETATAIRSQTVQMPVGEPVDSPKKYCALLASATSRLENAVARRDEAVLSVHAASKQLEVCFASLDESDAEVCRLGDELENVRQQIGAPAFVLPPVDYHAKVTSILDDVKKLGEGATPAVFIARFEELLTSLKAPEEPPQVSSQPAAMEETLGGSAGTGEPTPKK